MLGKALSGMTFPPPGSAVLPVVTAGSWLMGSSSHEIRAVGYVEEVLEADRSSFEQTCVGASLVELKPSAFVARLRIVVWQGGEYARAVRL